MDDSHIPLWYWVMSPWIYPMSGDLYYEAIERRRQETRKRRAALVSMLAVIGGGYGAF